MAKRHYHVVENTPGYLPESDPATFTNKRYAEQHAASLARELREDGYSQDGAATTGLIYLERDAGDLGRVIEILYCQETDCVEVTE